MPNLTIHKAVQYLAEHDNYAILTHRCPDGDTVGSAAALCLSLRQQGKTAHVLHNPEVTPRYAHLLQGLTKEDAQEGDTLVCVDVAAPNMLGDYFAHLADKIALRIDHHGTGASFTPDEYVYPEFSSCGDLIFDLVMEGYVDLDAPIANALYTAVATDTGCFRYANTNSHSFAVAGACAWASKDIFCINQELFETNSLAKLRMQAYLVENALFLQEGKAVICALPREKELELGVTEDDMENVSGFPRSIAGVKMAATLRQTPGGKVKLSMRAVPGYDAAAICARFGGGGHKGAAGATMEMTLEQAVEAVKAALPEME